MENRIIVPIVILIVLIGVLIILAIYLYRAFRAVQDSFNKIGHIAREDTKRYFEEVADSAKQVYAKSLEENKAVLTESMDRVIGNSTAKMKEVISVAEKEAAEIILAAHRDSESIKNDAKAQGEKYLLQVQDEAIKVIDWAMSQFIKDNYSIAEHENIIKKLITSYFDERKN